MGRTSRLFCTTCLLCIAWSISFDAQAADGPPPFLLAAGSPATGDKADGPQDQSPQTADDIIIYASRQGILPGVPPENELNEQDIAAYGANTVGDLLDQVGGAADSSGEGPVILINGRETTGLNTVNDLPTEAIRKIQVLPQRVAGRLGERPTRRVINVVLKNDHRQITGNAEGSFATAGAGRSYKAEINLLRLKNGNRDSLVFRYERADPLFESDRDIISEPLTAPYDTRGNIFAATILGAEIDPALSALAGQMVAVAPVPAGNAAPTLSALAANANRPAFTDVRDFRTLAAGKRTFSANGNLARQWGKTALSLNARAEWVNTDSQSGLAGVSLVLPAGTPFSPFTRDVRIARYVGDALRQQGHNANLELGGDFTTPVGGWNLRLAGSWQHLAARTDSQAAFDPTLLQAAINAGTVNPFGALPADLTLLRYNFSRSRSDNASLRATLSGRVLTLPAGAMRAAVTASIRTDRLNGRWEFLSVPNVTKFTQNEAALLGNLQVPLLSDKSQIGNLELDLNGAIRRLNRIGTIEDFGAGLAWQPARSLNFRGSFDMQRQAPSAQTLSDPQIVYENYRIFDFITGQTVQVRYITGGNPDLPVARRRIWSVGGTYLPFSNANLILSAEYSSRRTTNLQSTLPPVNAQVQAAFPNRFVRDANGVLTLVDSRPVAFAYDNSGQLHSRIDFHGSLGKPSRKRAAGSGSDSDGAFSFDDRARFNFSIEHNWIIRSVRRAQLGLPEVDLLAGGATGYGGGLARHTVRVSANLAGRGVGMQLYGTWRSATLIKSADIPSPSDVFFSAQTNVDMRLFADLGTLVPANSVLKGARLSVAVTNLLDSKQRVRDGSGLTPIRYQPYLLNPLGRAITIGLRKAF
jgi:iron complex outermembrane receptor protein